MYFDSRNPQTIPQFSAFSLKISVPLNLSSYFREVNVKKKTGHTFYWEVDDGGVLLHKEGVLSEPFDEQNDKLRQPAHKVIIKRG